MGQPLLQGGQMSSAVHLLRPTIPIAYLQLLVELLSERGISLDHLFAGQEMAAHVLNQPETRMSAQQWTRFVIRGLELSGDAALGYEYGMRMRPTAHGVVGYATMTCTTLRQAIEISVRYARIRQAHFTMRIEESDGYCLLLIQEKFSIPVLRLFFFENILLGLVKAMAVLLGRNAHGIDGLEILVDWPEPTYHRDWASRLPVMHFSQSINAIRISTESMNLRPVLADPHASQQAIALCERELALAIDLDAAEMTAKIRSALTPRKSGGYMQLEELALYIGISSRSIKRKLNAEGTSFRLMLEEARRRDAHQMLVHSNRSIQDISHQLGYLNPANFSRAFASWTGESPTHYRGQQKTPPIGMGGVS
jgi:AraC-like DNA-binding protein